MSEALHRFFLASPVQKNEIEAVEPEVCVNLELAMAAMSKHRPLPAVPKKKVHREQRATAEVKPVQPLVTRLHDHLINHWSPGRRGVVVCPDAATAGSLQRLLPSSATSAAPAYDEEQCMDAEEEDDEGGQFSDAEEDATMNGVLVLGAPMTDSWNVAVTTKEHLHQVLPAADFVLAEKRVPVPAHLASAKLVVLEDESPCVTIDRHTLAAREQRSVEQGVYATSKAQVTFATAKSVLNQFIMALPTEPGVTTSRERMQPYLPVYNITCDQLELPAMLNIHRTIALPLSVALARKKDRQAALALMACVRLHAHGYLTDNLVPVPSARPQIVVESILNDPTTVEPMVVEDHYKQRAFSMDDQGSTKLVVYRLTQSSARLDRFRRVLDVTELDLAVVLPTRLVIVPPPLSLQHAEFGQVDLSLGTATDVTCRHEQLRLLQDFFVLVMNARWKRKSKRMAFRVQTCPRFSYTIGCVDKEGSLNWDRMRAVVEAGRRTKEERKAAVRTWAVDGPTATRPPRLWCPMYAPYSIYIVYGPSGLECGADFPHQTEHTDVRTYADYYRAEWQFDVSPETALFDAQRLWHLPSNQNAKTRSIEDNMEADLSNSGSYEVCDQLVLVKLAQQACFEPWLADAGVFLFCTFLPHFLYHLERINVACDFVDYSSRFLPTLASVLQSLSAAQIASTLSAKSCRELACFERLEWLGDAVLKAIQTDATVKSIELRSQISTMDEGQLNELRSALGTNERLAAACKKLGVDRFVLTQALARGRWTPSPLERYATVSPSDFTASGSLDDQEEERRGKIHADIVEALLGLVFVQGSYDKALRVADECGLTIPWDDAFPLPLSPSRIDDTETLEAVQAFAHYNFNHHAFALEALTHPTTINAPTPNYQRLEWIGDAVLCLAARQWIFERFPLANVGDMVVMEATIVSNQTLAFLALQSGLYRFIIHNDATLGMRMNAYIDAVQRQGKGLWGQDPPKAMADIVEAVIGAVHVESGLDAALASARSIVRPVMDLLDQAQGLPSAMMRHAEKELCELGGRLVSIATWVESAFCQEYSEHRIWLGAAWGRADPWGGRIVADVKCADVRLIAVVDDCKSSAKNRASAIVLAVLNRNVASLERFKAARAEADRPVAPSEPSERSDQSEMH